MSVRKFRFTSNPAAVDVVCESLRELCRGSGIDDAVALQLELALAEALNNVIEHAYRFQPGRPIELDLEFSPPHCRIQLRDWGATIAPHKLSHPRALEFDGTVGDLASLPTEGRGIPLILACTDRTHYAEVDGANQLTLIKRV